MVEADVPNTSSEVTHISANLGAPTGIRPGSRCPSWWIRFVRQALAERYPVLFLKYLVGPRLRVQAIRRRLLCGLIEAHVHTS